MGAASALRHASTTPEPARSRWIEFEIRQRRGSAARRSRTPSRKDRQLRARMHVKTTSRRASFISVGFVLRPASAGSMLTLTVRQFATKLIVLRRAVVGSGQLTMSEGLGFETRRRQRARQSRGTSGCDPTQDRTPRGGDLARDGRRIDRRALGEPERGGAGDDKARDRGTSTLTGFMRWKLVGAI